MNNFTFGDIVIVEENLIGVIVKLWKGSFNGFKPSTYEVYVRSYNKIKEYKANEMRRYLVRHKELDETEIYYQDCCEGKIKIDHCILQEVEE